MKYTQETVLGVFRDGGRIPSLNEYYLRRDEVYAKLNRPRVEGNLRISPVSAIPLLGSLMCIGFLADKEDTIPQVISVPGFFFFIALAYMLTATIKSLDSHVKRGYILNGLYFAVSFALPIIYGVVCMAGILEYSSNVAFVMGGIVMILIALWCLYKCCLSNIIRKSRCSETADGTCVGFVDRIHTTNTSEMASHQCVVSAPVYEFEHNGQKHTVYFGNFEDNDFDLPIVGYRSVIRFNPKDPYDCMLGDGKPFRAWYLLGTIVAVLIAVVFFSCIR